jgi:peroxiredoxin Q/BCP
MIEVGERIDTDFTLEVVRDGEAEEITFGELLDRPTIVSVYMKNNTSSCDRQNRSLADEAEWFDERGYNLVALSKDGTRSHRNYAEKLGIGYTLASDPEYRFARATDSLVEKQMFGKSFQGPSRSAYVIDTDGTVLGIAEEVDTAEHAAQLRELVESI